MKQLAFTTLIVVAIMIVGSFVSGWMINRAMSPQKNEKRTIIRQQIEKSSGSEINSENVQVGGNQTASPSPESDAVQSESEKIIVYTDSGYSPADLGIKLGDTVIFENESSGKMWTASTVHPFHSAYDGTSMEKHCPDDENIALDQCEGIQKGESWLFKFDKKGVWEYHNHLKPFNTGTITVE